jgi:hypothetical protein
MDNHTTMTEKKLSVSLAFSLRRFIIGTKNNDWIYQLKLKKRFKIDKILLLIRVFSELD